LQAATVFSRKFPELSFLHIPSFSSQLNKSPSLQNQQPIMAILALCARFLSDANNGQGQTFEGAEEYAERTRIFISQSFVDPPRIETVQALLVTSMFEWAMGMVIRLGCIVVRVTCSIGRRFNYLQAWQPV
jgi:hypothetical protein